MRSKYQPYYDPDKSWETNLKNGPFGIFADGENITRKGEPEYELFDHKIHLPFGIPAGPLPNYNFINAAFRKGYDLPVYKTVRTKAKATHQWPNIVPVDAPKELKPKNNGLIQKDEYSDPLSITNSFGVGSEDPNIWQPDMRKAVESADNGQVMIASFQGTNNGEGRDAFIKDHVLGARLVKETGAKIIEMNASCPNEGTSDLLCFDLKTILEITDKVKNIIGNTPLLLKLAYFEDKQFLREYIKNVGKIIDGFSVINTIPSKIYANEEKTKQALPGKGRLISGVCGAPIKWAGIEMVSFLNNLRIKENLDYKIIASGGVITPQDYIDYRKQGADAVMSATGSMWRPYLARDIWNNFK
jgi:dihydroorotate dehydrogenase